MSRRKCLRSIFVLNLYSRVVVLTLLIPLKYYNLNSRVYHNTLLFNVAYLIKYHHYPIHTHMIFVISMVTRRTLFRRAVLFFDV